MHCTKDTLITPKGWFRLVEPACLSTYTVCLFLYLIQINNGNLHSKGLTQSIVQGNHSIILILSSQYIWYIMQWYYMHGLLKLYWNSTQYEQNWIDRKWNPVELLYWINYFIQLWILFIRMELDVMIIHYLKKFHDVLWNQFSIKNGTLFLSLKGTFNGIAL